ncbi:MAG: SurA N-terminal domain-containing protein [Balneolales bacterium]|nr:SurA N-terminal domain-containing protein [Balneolales bacterium]
MRDNTAIVLYILIGSFGLLWVIMDVYDPNAISMTPRSIGSVNGEEITVEEYESRIQYYTNVYSQQTGASMTAELRAIYESQVWDELVNTKLLEQKMDELGITVTDSELLEMVYSDTPDPLIIQYFSRPDGSIDRFAIENVLTDPTYSQETLAIEVQLRQKRRQEKLSNFITAGLQVTDQDVQDEFMKRNTFADVSFIRFPYNEVTDEEITVTDDDIRDYYNENLELYKAEENYRANFVSFSTLPTAEDSATIIGELEDARNAFATATNDSLFLIREQSTTGYNGIFINKDELREDYAPVLDVAVGEVTEIINLGPSVAVIKKIEEQGDEIRFAVLSKVFEALPATIDNAGEEADEFVFYAEEETSFADEAARSGLTPIPVFATKGNTFIAGLGSSQQVVAFLENADEGDISDPIELSSQFVVLEMVEKNEEGYRPLEEVRAQIEVQVKNDKRKEITLQRVRDLVATTSTLEALSEASRKEIQEQEGLASSALVLFGAGREPKVIGSVFAQEQGSMSDALEGTNGAYVVYVESVTEPNMSTLTDATVNSLRSELEQQVNQSYLSIWLDELKDESDIEDNRSRIVR